MNVPSIVAVKAPREGSSVYFSNFHLNSFANKATTSGIAIKYVIEGVESYYHDNNTIEVKAEHYLLLNKAANYEVCLEFARKPVKGLCINLSEDMIHDVLYNFQNDEGFLLENPFYTKSRKLEFFESVFRKDDVLSQHLKSLVPYLDQEKRTLNISDSELYYGIAGKLLASQNIISKEISGIKLQRLDVRKELYKRLLVAKTIMDDSSEHFKISEIAAQAALSEFHFFRTFKQAFGISPHQYQIRGKLEKAVCLLQSGKAPIEDIAFDCGFTDLFTFSKTFKKHFGIAPSFYKRSHRLESALVLQ